MIEKYIFLNSINKIIDFVNITNQQEFDIDIYDHEYVFNAKSIMNIFGLDLSTPKKIVIHINDENECQNFIKQIENFEVK